VKVTHRQRATIFIGVIAVLSSALAAHPAPVYADGAPIILFWTHYGQFLPRATFITPGPMNLIRSTNGTEMAEEAAHHPTHLRSRDGKVIAEERTAQQLADYWSQEALDNYGGIAIDEFGHPKEALNRKMANALALTDERMPNLFIAVWHAGPLTPELAESYKNHADLVILETYFSGTTDLADWFQAKVDAARLAGILSKTIFALGINDDDPIVGTNAQPWANTPAELQAQMDWIRANAPESPGIAFFAPRGSLSLQRTAYDLAVQIFLPAKDGPGRPSGSPSP
jgi:hypothetical protein